MEAFKLKPTIFDYFPPLYFVDDINKDSEGKGTNQRFHEMLAEEWDDELIPFIYNIVDAAFAERTPDKFIPYIEQYLGLGEPLADDFNIRRKLIKYFPKICKVKGTLPSYEILFKILGFTSVKITDLSAETGFDSPILFDDEQRRFDRNECQPCSSYNLELEGTMPITADLYHLIRNAVVLVEPINAKLNTIIYNQIEIDFTIFVAENGDLIVDNLGSSTLFVLKPNGDLIIISNKAQNYFINNGNLYKNGS